MSEVTLEAIEQLLDQKLEPINTKLTAIEEIVSGHTAQLVEITETVKKHTSQLTRLEATVDTHTNQLDGIAKDVKTLLEENPVQNHRLNRLEEWGVKAGEKIDAKLTV